MRKKYTCEKGNKSKTSKEEIEKKQGKKVT